MKTISLFFCLLPWSLLCAQTYLFDSESSGFHIGAQFTSTNGSTLFGLSPGYVANGKVGFGVTIGSATNSDYDLSATVVKPYLNYLVFRQGENDMPVSVSVNGGYQYNTYKDLDINSNIIDFGLSIIHQIKATHNLDIFPAGGVGWDKTRVNANGFTEDSSSIGYGLSATFLFSKKFYVDPSLSFGDGSSVFSLFLGLLFP